MKLAFSSNALISLLKMMFAMPKGTKAKILAGTGEKLHIIY